MIDNTLDTPQKTTCKSDLDWITDNYDNIIQWAKNMTKGDPISTELAHYALEQFLTHKRYGEIMDRNSSEPDFGHARSFILAIMRNSWYSKKSEFKRVNANHRADIGHRKKTVDDELFQQLENQPDEPYDYEIDFLTEAVEGILEEMELDYEGKLWYNARLFKMWLETQNYSEIARKTSIPRTSISNAVEEAKTYIKEELKNRKII